MFYPMKVISHAVPATVLMTMAIAGLHAETNPIIKDIFTADPAAVVYGDTVCLYVGHDEEKGREMFTMKEWHGLDNVSPRGPHRSGTLINGRSPVTLSKPLNEGFSE
jgi:hypothetical protein